MQCKSAADLLTCLLNLKRKIVAVSLMPTKEMYFQQEVPELKRPLAFCMIVRLATIGHGRKASKTEFRCPGASEVFLFRSPKSNEEYGKRLFSFGLYNNRETACNVQTSMATIPEPCYGVVVQPFSTCAFVPDTIILFANGYQAMRLTQAWAYSFGPLQGMSLTGNRGVCAESVAAPLSSGKMHLSPLCSNTRYAAKWDDNELGLGIPYQRIEGVINGLVQTIPAVEPLPRRNAIISRCQELGIDLEIAAGKTYFPSQ